MGISYNAFMLKTQNRRYRLLVLCLFSLFLSTGCPTPTAEVLGPILEAGSPINMGQSPVNIRKRETIKLRNVGDAKLTINDFEIEPDDGTFLVQIGALPLIIQRDSEKEMQITFSI